MATAIRNIPTLCGAEADTFLHAAEATEANPGTVNFRHNAKIVREYLMAHPLL